MVQFGVPAAVFPVVVTVITVAVSVVVKRQDTSPGHSGCNIDISKHSIKAMCVCALDNMCN